MSVKLKPVVKSMAAGLLVLLLLGFATMNIQANDADLSQATFYVY